jgi:hypothetical protein
MPNQRWRGARTTSGLICIALVVIGGLGSAGAGAPEIRTDKDVYAPQEPITVDVRSAPGTDHDWITVVPEGTPIHRYRQTIYLKGKTTGSFAFHGLPAGQYEARLLVKRGSRSDLVAQYAFRVGEPPTAGVPAEGRTAASPSPSRPGSGGDAKTAPAGRLSPEMERLIGTWLAHTRCDTAGNRKLRPQQILLTVREGGAKSGEASAEVRGIDGTAGIALAVAFDGQSRRYRFTYVGWLPVGTGSRQKPYGLALAFRDQRDFLHGEIIGRTDCEPVVAGRLPSDNASPNPQGLLYKVAVNRVLTPLTKDDCATYARWLAGGDVFQVYGSASWFNSAVADGPAIRRVLGHDLGQWTDEDARKVGVIHGACHKLLKASADAALVELANHRKIWDNVPPPLSWAPSKYPDWWSDTYFALHRPLVMDILKAAQAGETERAAQPPGALAAAPPDAMGLVGEWRGYYRCKGRNEVFMRLTFAPAGGQFDVRFEFGPSLRTSHPFGVLGMTGTLAAGQVTLAPRAWITQPRGQIQPLGFEGRLAAGGRLIEGQVKGNPDCPDFSVTKREIVSAPVNPDGLLFHHLAKDKITATVEHCRAYAEWLVAGDEINLGDSSIFSGFRNPDTMRAVLGKDLYQWGTDDPAKMYDLARHCQALLRAQMNPEISDLVARIAAKKLVWAPNPLTTPRTGNTVSHWLRAEQLVMQNEQQKVLAAQNLVVAGALPPEVASVDRIDALAAEARKRTEGPVGHLSKPELEAYMAGLTAARGKVAVATAEAAAGAWKSHSPTYAALQQVETEYMSLRQLLESRKAGPGVSALDVAFRGEADRRADALWPEILRTTMDELRERAAADLSRFRELRDSQQRQAYLGRFHSPSTGDHYFADYQSALSRYRETVDRMVERSRSKLITWIDGLPASARANALLDAFSMEVFGTSAIPERHPAVRQAATEKKRAYNPDGYLRPDIVMALKRKQWSEVSLVGLDDLAYLTTSLRIISDSCPGAVPEGSTPLMGLALSLSQEAVARAMRGEVSGGEARRVVLLFMNNVMNRPGCRVNYYGRVIGCVSPEDHAATQEAIMTSGDAQFDMRTLLRAGCGLDGAGGFVQALIAYAGNRTAPSGSVPRDFWAWGAQRP